MSLILSGSDGLSDVDGSASTPAIRGTDANTGIFFPAADTVAISEGGVESARFNSSGNLQLVNSLSIGNATPTTSGAGITFPATQSASTDANTLDDYEEGTWTPSAVFNLAAVGQTGTFAGFYTKIGNQVFATCLINLTAKGSSTGGLAIAGLPFASNSNSNYRAMSSTIIWGSLATNYVYMLGLISPNVTYIDIYAATAATAGSAGSQPLNTDINNTSSFRISITYQV